MKNSVTLIKLEKSEWEIKFPLRYIINLFVGKQRLLSTVGRRI